MGNRAEFFIRGRWGKRREKIYDSGAPSLLVAAGSDNVYIFRRALFAPYDAFHKDQDDDVSGSLLATL